MSDLVINGQTYSGIEVLKMTDTNHNQILFAPSTLGTININDYIEGKTIPSVYINNTISYIKSSAFYNRHLQQVYIPNCTNVGAYCFRNVTSFSTGITNIYAPKLSSIGTYAFAFNPITNINFSNCTDIGNGAFSSCSYLTDIYMPNIETIGGYAFYKCNSLPSISFSQCSYIGESAFYGCNKLSTITLTSITTVGSSAFHSCIYLSVVYLYNSSNLLRLSSSAFYYCTSLRSLYLLCSYVITLASYSVFYSTPLVNYSPRGSIFVPESLVSAYKSAYGWSAGVFSSLYVGLTDAELNEIKTQVGIG